MSSRREAVEVDRAWACCEAIARTEATTTLLTGRATSHLTVRRPNRPGVSRFTRVG